VPLQQDFYSKSRHASPSEFQPDLRLCSDLLTSTSNQFIFVPNCTKVEDLVKFPQAVCKTHLVYKLSVYDHEYTDSPKTKCLQMLITGRDMRNVEINVKLIKAHADYKEDKCIGLNTETYDLALELQISCSLLPQSSIVL